MNQMRRDIESRPIGTTNNTVHGAQLMIRAASRGRFKPYPSYRNTEVEWLSKIPQHWGLERLKFATIINPSSSEISGLEPISEVSFIPMESVGTYGGLDLAQTKTLEEARDGYTYFRNGDVVVAKITPCFENGKGALAAGLVNGVAFGTTELHVLRPRGVIDAGYLFYATLCDAFRSLGEAEMYGAGGQKRVPESFVANLRHPIPPLPEQCAIAKFLDRETARIDGLIATKERLRELLHEQRSALIANAVKKGPDPSAPLKDSGIEWLGYVPRHWQVVRTKYAAKLRSGHTPSRQHAEYWENCTIPWFGLVDIWQVRNDQREYVFDTAEKISEVGLANSAARLLPKGTVILSRTASVGFSAILGVEMATTQDFVNWICGPDMRPDYLLYVFRAMRRDLQRLSMGSTHQTIYMPDVNRFVTPIPPLKEQDAIVALIRERSKRIDDLVRAIDDALTWLREFRTALISTAVTGQIDIRDEVA